MKIRICSDLPSARNLWKRYYPKGCLFDFWEVRDCFRRPFDRPLHFLVAESNGRFAGMLALSWIAEEGYFGHFPGETWQGKTWLEQNRMVARSAEAATALLAHLPDATTIRYLAAEENTAHPMIRTDIDEIGYLFFPGSYEFSFDAYLGAFPGKTRKKLLHECRRLEGGGLSFRHDCFSDLAHMFRMNLDGFGSRSYFADSRFLKSFENLAAWLQATGALRVSTVVIGGRVAAVDMGAVVDGRYTVLAGGTDPEFAGVAKVINLHHMQWACRSRLKMVDFLCGDFNWKQRLRLSPRPLYQWVKQAADTDLPNWASPGRSKRVH